jgi:lincosamide and streptogramin A transport system ATP-binding/permease protein
MSLIQILNFSYTHKGAVHALFDHVQFQIDSQWKLGFIGRNGRGKTSFLRCLLGELEYHGEIKHQVEFSYFPLAVKDRREKTIKILDELSHHQAQWMIERELNLLNVNLSVLDQAFETLSGGEQTKVLLAALFLKPHAFLLFDEPTNHLDQEARASIADYLNTKEGFILVSHDRSLLNACVDHILVINKTDIEVQKGNFASWWENKQREVQFELMQNEKLKKEAKRLKEAMHRTSEWSDDVEKSKYRSHNTKVNARETFDRGYIGHKSAKMMKRSKTIELRQTRALDQKKELLKNVEESEALKIHPLVYRQNQIISFDKVGLRFNERVIFRDLSFTVYQGDRLAIRGPNGSGKTSILRIILALLEHSEGEIHQNKDLVISIVEQDARFLQGSLNRYIEEQACDEPLFKAILRKMDFDRDQFDIPMERYSEGQKKKVLIAKSLSQSAHLYLWDEPLNFIDVLSRIQIEELILRYCPTMIFVEHDQTFIEKIATKIIQLNN